MSEPAEITVDVISDVACPWCFVGMKRLERAIALAGDVDVHVRWRPYQLDGAIPAEGLPRRQYMLDKFGSEERLREIHDKLVGIGEAEGIRFNFDAMQVSANTLDAHRLIRWAASPKSPPGTQPRMVKRLFEMNFEEGRDIGDRTVLVEAADEVGMDSALVEALLTSNADTDSVRAEIGTAAQMGVRGVPCFLLEGKYAVMGAQEAETLADAIRQIATAKARGELDEKPAT
ncbi:DsbA family oxidoreductase [Mesorhizobium microcysteis]|uniref:DsbA family oxidoreductase n=1 Tax=Neoaquamicrobium microcysteis TaxID=2682781 RepID=A0A5D4H4N0_9HYPH|nr:DsbA family oxidoreductase [Mesorhizobium microcysteis]TYR35213.1 DsbA family oxidoreductase [Mesorhizobium microcysteis]